MNKYLLCIVVVFFLSIFGGCRKNDIATGFENDPATFLKEARSYFKSEVLPTAANAVPGRISALTERALVWDEAIAKKSAFGRGSIVIVPVKYKTDLYFRYNAGYDYLSTSEATNALFYRDSLGKMHADVITTIPNKIDPYNLSETPEKFTGKILIETWNGHEIANYEYFPDGSYKSFWKSDPTNGRISVDPAMAMGKCIIDYYYCASAGSYRTCRYSYSVQTDCGTGVGSTSPTYTGPGAPNLPGVGGSIGGGIGGVPGRPGVKPAFSAEKITVDPSAPTCLSQINTQVNEKANLIQMAINAFYWDAKGPYNQMANMIYKISTDPNWKLIIKAAPIPDEVNSQGNLTTRNAQTIGVGSHVEITFNTNYLRTATDLSIARTLLHEMVHSYFTFALANTLDPDYNTFRELNTLLFVDESKAIDRSVQHNQMANSYIKNISSILYAYTLVAGISSPRADMTIQQYCDALAWGGLTETEAYNNYAVDKNNIQAILLAELQSSQASTKVKSCN
ncbi:MAG TPA: hypothetical protein VM802_09720 [Chitinophaga sp.]|uniref:hypothetical protein n=1 Tax=Chitinophaga sp. TaxID=1869181 RepID=UPI002C7B114C|nr:hypothetical protein [Chitinophaga sp.]HVI45140.1 hypothetical protein [Chitinophaga sp.]